MARKILLIIGILAGITIACFSLVYGMEISHAFSDAGNTLMLAVSASGTIIGVFAGAILTAFCSHYLLFDN